VDVAVAVPVTASVRGMCRGAASRSRS
jgi:hypothetical protein